MLKEIVLIIKIHYMLTKEIKMRYKLLEYQSKICDLYNNSKERVFRYNDTLASVEMLRKALIRIKEEVNVNNE